jgi:hypothetical protein
MAGKERGDVGCLGVLVALIVWDAAVIAWLIYRIISNQFQEDRRRLDKIEYRLDQIEERR